MFTVSADPTVAFVDAVKTKLSADSVLVAMVTGIYGHLSEAARTNYPYIVLARRESAPAGAMQLAGSEVTLFVDVWSDAKGPFTVTSICSRVYAVLERQPLSVGGFVITVGSMTRVAQTIFDEPDADDPNQLLYHGVQQWTAIVEETH